MAITFTRIDGDKWALRVENAKVWPGKRVTVTRRDGSTDSVNVGNRVRSGKGYSVWSIAEEPVNAVPDYIPPEVGRYSTPTETIAEAEARVATCEDERWHPLDEAPGAPEREQYDTAAPTGPAFSGASVGTVVRSDRLSYHGPTRSFTVELSSLGDVFTSPPDELAVESVATGKLADFTLNRVDLTPDREISGWEYLCDAHGLKLTVIND
jgi:hypothetical protein